MIKKVGNEWCLIFSDGRKECGTKEQMKKREKQVNFFKHKNKELKNSAEYYHSMVCLGVFAEYCLEESGENIYLVIEEDQTKAFLESNGNVYALDSEYTEISKYSEILSEISKDSETKIEAQDAESIDFNLSEAFIDNQLIKGSHTHKVSLKSSDFSGYSSEEMGHKHYVDMYNSVPYIGHAPIDINGIKISHTHFIHVTPKS